VEIFIQKLYRIIKKHCPHFVTMYVKRFGWIVFNIIANLRYTVNRNKYTVELEAILASHREVRGVIIHPSNVDWFSVLFQRFQQLAICFSKRNYLFFYCSPTFYKKGFIKISENLFVCSYDTLNALRAVPLPIIYINPKIYAENIVSKYKNYRLLYDYSDDLDVWVKDKKMKEAHEFLLNKASLVIATADNLYNEVREKHSNVILCNNGVNYEYFHKNSRAGRAKVFADIEQIANFNRPIVGFYGALARWFDWDLFLHAVTSRLDYSFVLMGHDYDGSIENIDIARYPNLYFLGEKKHQDLPSYLYHFNVAIIPFIVNKITNSFSSVKLFEYMAGGKPIVTTAIKECYKYKSVLVSGNKEEFVQNLDKAIGLGKNREYLNLLDREARDNTWDKRIERIIESI